MATPARPMLRSIATALAVALTLAGCATRFDSSGNRIYVWQFGQDTDRAIDYSNPRLPLLPRTKPLDALWPIPSPYEFNDLSRYSFLKPAAPLDGLTTRVGDNAACAASCKPYARLALLAPRADARGDSLVSASR